MELRLGPRRGASPGEGGRSARRAGRQQVSYAGLVEKLAAIGIRETDANLRNKISRGGFTGAFLIQCLTAMGVTSLRLEG